MVDELTFSRTKAPDESPDKRLSRQRQQFVRSVGGVKDPHTGRMPAPPTPPDGGGIVNARRARRHTLVPFKRISSPWRPQSGAGIEVDRINDWQGTAIICPHQTIYADVGDVDTAIGLWGRVHPECPISWVRLYFGPARLIVDTFNGGKTKPSTPARIAKMVDNLHVYGGLFAAFLDSNPPESCGCDPGVELVYRYQADDASVIRLCHDEGCSGVGREPVGRMSFIPTGRPA